MRHLSIAIAALAGLILAGCTEQAPMTRSLGQTTYSSAPPAGSSSRGSFGTNAPGAEAASDASAGAKAAAAPPTREVQETDIYRLEGNRLYFLNSYRGLMVFDVSNVDQPKLLGRSPIFGWPVDMIVKNGIATVVVADWYGAMEDGTPFHGSIVRGLDATNPADIKLIGEAKLGGWVRDDRVVGDVLYAVSEDYGWYYGWDGTGQHQPAVVVSSVNFANGQVQAVSKVEFPGYTGIFNVTTDSILLAHAVARADPRDYTTPAQTELIYLDISDPNGAIVQRGSAIVTGQAQGWGADNGRWNLDFADGKTAHVIGCVGKQYYWCDYNGGYLLSTVDFSNPDAPFLKSQLSIPSQGYGVAARFGANRLYLSPENWYGTYTSTPFKVFDLTDAANPFEAGTVNVPGTVWNILPAPNLRLFALGQDWGNQGYGRQVSLNYLDVTDPADPKLLGTSKFGQGWAWTPAAGTFKAFTMDAAKGLVVLPFSGWSETDHGYNNGLQLIQFTNDTTNTAGAAKTKGWVERGIFVQNRLVSLSDLSLAVVDYADPMNPTVTASLTLARNVIAAQPNGATIAQISTDWWGNDLSTSEVRILPIADAAETTDVPSAITLTVPGLGARVFMNDHLAYIVSSVRVEGPCPNPQWGTTCHGRQQQVQVVDLAGGNAVLRGTIKLPVDSVGGYGWWWDWCGWWGFWWYDWYWGPEVAQVGSDALAFRRWQPVWDANGYWLDANSLLYVVDLSNADGPTLASTTITDDPRGWWGNMKVVGQTLYTNHYEWLADPNDPNGSGTVRYYLDRIDLTDRQHPKVGSKINVPGLLVAGFDTDPSQLLFIDYRWDDVNHRSLNDFTVCRVTGDVCELRSTLALDGWAGRTFVRGTKAYVSTQVYDWNYTSGGPRMQLHAIDLSNPWSPVDRTATATAGWGWLLDVEGDRAVVSSGWGLRGIDIYKLVDGQAPQFRQFVRTAGWWVDGVSRQDDQLFVASGYWGVQKIDLQ